MEGIFLVLIGAALFSQSWYLLGLYIDGRTMGVVVGGLGLMAVATVLLSSADGALANILLTADGKGTKVISDANVMASATVIKMLVMLWAVYALAVAAHGLWDLDERAIGFFSGFLALATLAPMIYFAIELQSRYGDAVWLALSGATGVLSLLAAILFFYMAFPFHVLRLVAGWFILIGGSAVVAIGLLIVSSLIEVS